MKQTKKLSKLRINTVKIATFKNVKDFKGGFAKMSNPPNCFRQSKTLLCTMWECNEL